MHSDKTKLKRRLSIIEGQIAQQIFWYTAFTADMTKPGLPVVNADGTPKWRMAPGPNGPYWKQGMQNGYQDVGSWTFFKNLVEHDHVFDCCFHEIGSRLGVAPRTPLPQGWYILRIDTLS
jgi:hypothetical protein